jgi:hypothetical protein
VFLRQKQGLRRHVRRAQECGKCEPRDASAIIAFLIRPASFLSFATITPDQELISMPKTLLVVGGSPKINWYEIFRGATVCSLTCRGLACSLGMSSFTECLLDALVNMLFLVSQVSGEPITVEMAHWDEIHLTSYSDSRSLIATLAASSWPLAGTPNNSSRTCQPDFLLIRSACRGVHGILRCIASW